MDNIFDAQKLLEARFDDCLSRAERGELVCGNFLTPAEVAQLAALVRLRKLQKSVFFFGGYDGAERKRAYFLPPFLSELEGDAKSKVGEYLPDALALSVRTIKINGSGFRELSHRDYLGALLSLGIERHSIGDVIVMDNYHAIVFCTAEILEFLLCNIDRIASDKVTVGELDPSESISFERKFRDISDTVASDRLDCVVASLTGSSRQKAQSMITSGLCEIDHVLCDKCDRGITPPCIISLRGHGKFNVVAFDGETKKGRLRLLAQKYL